MVRQSPYDGVPESEWLEVTKELIHQHPLSTQLLVKATLEAWDEIFNSTVGTLRIGADIFPEPQMMGFFLHHLIPEVIARTEPGWARGKAGSQKDLHCEADASYSVEVKTSSNPRDVYGNRSYAQPATVNSRPKDGYYLAVNFQKWSEANGRPKIVRIRFGWLDHTDWKAQESATGQQASVRKEAKASKLVDLL